jgi:putative spermidine/putrescine transport system substrate-binding protein
MKKVFLLLIILFLPIITSVNAEVTIASWGGAYTESQIKGYKDTYTKPSSVKFVNYNGGLDEVRSQVESGNVKWDIIDVLPNDAINGCDEGLFENISSKYNKFPKGPNNTNIIKDMQLTGISDNLSDCCVPQIFWSYVVFYDPGAFPGNPKPQTVADFFNVKKFPGKRGVHAWANGFIEMALVADGVSASAVYTVLKNQTGAVDRAFAVMDKIKDHIVHWSAGSKPIELVKSGEVVMSIGYNGRVGAAVLAEGENFKYIWDSQVLEQEFLCLVKGSKNRKQALDFLQHSSSPQSLAEQARYVTYGPMRASSVDIIAGNEPWFHNGKNVYDHIPNTPEKLAVSIMADPYWWSSDGWKISERYNTWMDN